MAKKVKPSFKKSKQRPSSGQRKLYGIEQLRQQSRFAKLAHKFTAGSLSRAGFHKAMKGELKRYHIRLALIAKGGRKLTARDQRDVGKFLTKSYTYLNGFVNNLRGYKASLSQAQIEAEAASYANNWAIFTRFSIPAIIADLLPALPGIDCLGQTNCGCWLEWSVSGSTAEVRWFLNPSKENCVNCMAFAAEWQPLVIDLPSKDEVDEEDWLDMEDW